jgi:hypothetical protein
MVEKWHWATLFSQYRMFGTWRVFWIMGFSVTWSMMAKIY